MQHVLVYGDSLSWGLVPGTRQRLPFDQRWPGVLERHLNVRIIEDCLNGRRTVWDDPFKPGRNGLIGLAQRIEVNSPLSLVILMLGSNDFQFCHPHNEAWSAAQGVARLVSEIRTAPIEPGMPVPPILIVSPPLTSNPKGEVELKFRDAEQKSVGLASAYQKVAAELGCAFFDAHTVAATSEEDGVHLDAANHLKLGSALVDVVQSILNNKLPA